MAQPTILYPERPYLATATAAATDAYSGAPAYNALSAREDTYWRPANTSGAKTLFIDLGEIRDLNALGLVGEGLDGVTMTLTTSLDNVSWSTKLNAATLHGPVNAAWASWTAAYARYVSLTFSSFGSNFRVAWACLANYADFPYLESDFDPHNVDDAGASSVSPGGLFLGTIQLKSMREFSLRFGQITPAEMIVVSAFVDQCVKTARPFLFVPDTAAQTCFFCFQNKPKFSAPYRLGAYDLEPITVLTRAV
jgi:hypothetical protein